MQFLKFFTSKTTIGEEINRLIEELKCENALYRPNNPHAKRCQAKIEVLLELSSRLGITIKD